MRLGIDFDNTIVCYDALFHRVALEGGWIPADLPANKSDVRNHLRQIGREDVWTAMQGTVYGPRLAEAAPFQGVLEFFRACRTAGLPVCIISHKTRTPFAGEPHDLHKAALDWLEAHAFFDPSDIGLPRSQVFLERTKQAKLARIGACACTHFIDDLPEFLAEAAFPPTTQRILFDPNRLYGTEIPFARLHHWSEAQHLLPPQEPPAYGVRRSAPLWLGTECSPSLGKAVQSTTLQATQSTASTREHQRVDANPESIELREAAAALLGVSASTLSVQPLPGGANNRVYQVRSGNPNDTYVLKRYFQNPADPRDRFGTERAFYLWAQSQNLRHTPEPVAWDDHKRIALFRFVPGRKLQPAEVTADHVNQAIAFILELNASRSLPDAQRIPVASEACFSFAEHIHRIDERVRRFREFRPETDLDSLAVGFIASELFPAWDRVRTALQAQVAHLADAPLPAELRCLSPSDFGFHNALLTPDGTLRFLDFEYAGWDDPAKLICDFFCQPQIPIEKRFWSQTVSALSAGLDWGPDLAERAARLLPAFQIKWCCILLNEFLRTGLARRTFASGTDPEAIESRKASQLEKAKRALYQFA